MKSAFLCLTLLGLSSIATAQSTSPGNRSNAGGAGSSNASTTAFTHSAASVHIPGNWHQIDNGKGKDLCLQSDAGQKILVIADDQGGDIALGQLDQIAEFVCQARARALQLLADDTQFSAAEISSDREQVIRCSYGHSAGKHTRTAVRVEATAKRVRTTLIFDNDAKSDADFVTWSKSIFVGVR